MIDLREDEDLRLLEWAAKASSICPPGLRAVNARGLCQHGLLQELRYGVFSITDQGRAYLNAR